MTTSWYEPAHHPVTIGIVSPGAMGSALGRAWTGPERPGKRVVVTVAGRSSRTAGLAEGLELLPDLAAVVSESDVVISVCPPGAADEVLDAVIAAALETGSTPLLVDANAVAPERVRAMAERAASSGLDLVDGSVSGAPPTPTGDTMLYLSGARAGEVALLGAIGLRRRVVGAEVGQASAVKMCTASVYKGTTAVWSQALEAAQALGVLDVVTADLGEELPGQVASIGRRLAVATAKSARFADEMEQIAQTQAGAGLSSELFLGMAAVYRRLATTPLASLTPEEAASLSDLREILDRLRPTTPDAD